MVRAREMGMTMMDWRSSNPIHNVLGALLSYPTEELIEALPELQDALWSRESPVLSWKAALLLDGLIADLRTSDIYDAQERYVALFDRVRSLSLHLYEHLHGETRDRGQAMVDLRQVYESRGLVLNGGELPDYLPAFLEFLSLIEADEARTLLAQTADILKSIGARLDKRGSSYASVFAALLEIAGGGVWLPDSVSIEAIRLEDDPALLDALWAEQPAFGSPGQCGATAGEAPVSAVRFHGRQAERAR